MKVYCFYNSHYEKLYHLFRDSLLSLKEGFELKSLKTEEDFPYLDTGYTMQHGKYKIQFIINAIKENLGESIVFCDVDIKFFNPFKLSLQKVLKRVDVAFQAQYSERRPRRPGLPPFDLNGGFMAINCNPTTLEFFKNVLKVNDAKTIIEKALFVNLHLVKHELLSIKFASLTNGGVGEYHDQIYLLHANVHDASPRLIKKMNRVMKRTKESLNGNRPLSDKRTQRQIELQGNKKVIEQFVKNDCKNYKNQEIGVDCDDFWVKYNQELNGPGCRGCFQRKVIKKYADLARAYLLTQKA
tara:strand:+ start:532 stop:1425 length:894 start_codon:yes stop_codon:yes gene_type:complete